MRKWFDNLKLKKIRTKIGNSSTFLLVMLDHGFKPAFSHIHGLATLKNSNYFLFWLFELFLVFIFEPFPPYLVHHPFPRVIIAKMNIFPLSRFPKFFRVETCANELSQRRYCTSQGITSLLKAFSE